MGGVEKRKVVSLTAIPYFVPVSFQFGERVTPDLRQCLLRTWGSCAQQVVWTKLSLMFLPGGQTKVSWSLVGCCNYLTTTEVPHTYSIAGGCCPKREDRATTPKDLCGACPCPARPTNHTNNCTWHPTAEHSLFVLLVYWPRELDTHTNAEINIGHFL